MSVGAVVAAVVMVGGVDVGEGVGVATATAAAAAATAAAVAFGGGYGLVTRRAKGIEVDCFDRLVCPAALSGGLLV